jgi:HaeII restriction endonuclease
MKMSRNMNLKDARERLDSLIRKSRAHFYKPIHVAEVLHQCRVGGVKNVGNLEDYRARSKHWRDEVCQLVLGRKCTSSAQYQDAVFGDRGCPPKALRALADFNNSLKGGVEAYIYGRFRSTADQVAAVASYVEKCQPQDLSIAAMLTRFDNSSQLGRSADKVFEICVAALLATMTEALKLRVRLEWDGDAAQSGAGQELLRAFGVEPAVVDSAIPARSFRVGSTNAADGGVDIATNFGVVVQVKRRQLDLDMVSTAVAAVSAPRLLLACESYAQAAVKACAERATLLGMKALESWFKACASGPGAQILKQKIVEGLEVEFPSVRSFAQFMRDRGYDTMRLPSEWKTS